MSNNGRPEQDSAEILQAAAKAESQTHTYSNIIVDFQL